MDSPCSGLCGAHQEEDLRSLCLIVSSLFIQHPDNITAELLANLLSCKQFTRGLWASMAKNSATAERVLRMLLERMKKEEEEERRDVSTVLRSQRVIRSVAAISAVHEIVNAVEDGSVINNLFPKLLCALITEIIRTRARDTTGRQAFHPRGLAVETLKDVLVRQNLCDDTDIMEGLELLSEFEETHPEGMFSLARFLVTCGRESIGEVVSGLLPVLETSRPAHLITVTAFFVELLYHPGVMDKKIAKSVLKSMIRNSASCDSAIRCLSIQALGNAANGANKLIKKYKDSILGTLLAALREEQQEPKVIEESLKATAKIVRLLTRKEIGKQFVEMALYSQKLLDNNNGGVQVNAILLLGELGLKYKKVSAGSAANHFQSCLPSLLVKIPHKDIEIASSARFALYHCLPVVGCRDMQSLVHGQNMELKTILKTMAERHAEVARDLVAQCVKRLLDMETLGEIITLIGDLLEFMDLRDLYKLNKEVNLEQLWKDMTGLSQYPIPLVKDAAHRTQNLLQYKWPGIRLPPLVLYMKAALRPTDLKKTEKWSKKPLETIKEEEEETEEKGGEGEEEWCDCAEEM